MDANHNRVIRSRQRQYGPPLHGHACLGKAWTALINEHLQTKLVDLPPHLVCLMLASLKLHRAAKPFEVTPDTYLDARNYTTLAERVDPRISGDKPQ